MCRLDRTSRSKNKGRSSGAKSERGRLREIKRGRGIKGRDDKSRGVEILTSEAFAKMNPTDPLILA
jgi:hypothetical protein